MQKLFIIGLLCLFLKTSFSQEQKPVKVYNLDELRISATRMNTKLKNIPQKVEIIDKSVINSVPSENLAELLKRTTNLDIIQYPGLKAQIGMRGFSPSAHSRSYTLLLINGKPSGTTNLATINTDNILRVEVIKGPYSALYGSDAMGGVINIITESATTSTKGNVSISAGSFGSMKLRGSVSGQLNSKTTFTLGYSRKEQLKDYRIGKKNFLKLSNKEKLILDEVSYGDVMRNSKYQINHVNGQLEYTLNNKWSANAEILYTFAHDIETPGNYWGSYGQKKKDINRLNLYGNIKRSTNKNTFIVSPYFTRESNPNYTNNSDDGYVSFESNIRRYGFKIHDNTKLDKINILVGADLDVYDYKSKRFKKKATPTNLYSPNHKNTKAALFTQIAYSTGGLYFNAGARYDHISYNIEKNDLIKGTGGSESYNTFNPSIGIQYTFPFNLKLHGSFGTAFSVPDAFKVAGSYSGWRKYVGNPDLKPENSSTYDIGINYSFKNRLIYADFTYFQTKHKDKIISYSLDASTFSFKNANKSNMNGIEFILSSNIGNLFANQFKLEIYGNFTFMLKNEIEENSITKTMLYTRKSNSDFGVFFDNNKGFSTRLNARYIGNRLEKDFFGKTSWASSLRPKIEEKDYYTKGGYTVQDKVLEHPDYLVFDFSVNYVFQKNKRFGISVSNLLDENYTEKDGYNMPGRVISANFVYSF
jgi:outer membrane receptor protein involved in Fe transport